MSQQQKQQKTTFKTKSMTSNGAVCDMIQQAVEQYYNFKVLSVVGLGDMNTKEPDRFSIEYLKPNGKPDIAVFTTSEILGLIGHYVRAPAKGGIINL